jgi:hypothetical protein
MSQSASFVAHGSRFVEHFSADDPVASSGRRSGSSQAEALLIAVWLPNFVDMT